MSHYQNFQYSFYKIKNAVIFANYTEFSSRQCKHCRHEPSAGRDSTLELEKQHRSIGLVRCEDRDWPSAVDSVSGGEGPGFEPQQLEAQASNLLTPARKSHLPPRRQFIP
jgi:hypothetical protein